MASLIKQLALPVTTYSSRVEDSVERKCRQTDTLVEELELLRYEIALLRKRNDLLAQENKKLLDHYEQKENEMQNRQLDKSNIKAMQALTVLKGRLQGSRKQQEMQMHRIIKECQGNLKLSGTINESLSEVISFLIKSFIMHKQQQPKRLEGKLLGMKGKRDQDKRLVYVVNDPLEEFYALDTQSHEQDVDFLQDSYENLVRRVKRDDINIRKLQGIYDEIEGVLRIRKQMRKQQRLVQLFDREMTLGHGCTGLEDSQQRLECIRMQLLRRRSLLKETINSI